MKRGRIGLALVLAVVLAAAFTLAYAASKAPDKPVTVESKDVFKERKKAPVVFDHAKHKEAKCDACHHVYKDGKNVFKEGDEVQKCGACHKLEDQDKVLKLEKAFHKQCQDCHKKLKKEKQKTGPTACGKCHPGAKDE